MCIRDSLFDLGLVYSAVPVAVKPPKCRLNILLRRPEHPSEALPIERVEALLLGGAGERRELTLG